MTINIHAMMSESNEIIGEAAQLASVNKNGCLIKYMHHPSEEVQLAAVNQNGNAIQYIHNPSEYVQLEAVKDNGYSIVYIDNPSEAVQQAALEQNKECISYFKKAWLKNNIRKIRVEEIEEILGYSIEVIS